MSKKQIFHPEQKDKDFVIGAYSDAVEVDGKSGLGFVIKVEIDAIARLSKS